MRVVYLLVLRYLRSNQDAVLRELNLKVRKAVTQASVIRELGLREWEVRRCFRSTPNIMFANS